MREKAGGGGADAYLEFSSDTAVNSSHIVNSLGSLRGGGRVVFKGGIRGSAEIPYSMV